MQPAVKNGELLSRAEKVFKKTQLLAEGPTAAREYRQKQKAALENMERLRRLRLSQQDQRSAPTKKSTV
jgi:hypothetical protein